MRKIRVLIVAGEMNVGGQENQLMHLIRNADPEKFQIDFTSTNPEAFYRNEIEALGGKFVLVPDIDWKQPWVFCRAFYRILKNGKYDIVHANELFHSGITLAIAFFAGVPCRFAHSHSCSMSARKLPRWVINVYMVVMRWFILLFSTKQLACSSWAGNYLYGELATKKSTYHLIYNSVDTSIFLDRFDKIETGEFCEDPEWINILHVGRVVRLKNQELLTRIACYYKNQGKKIRFLCAGAIEEQDYFDEVETYIQENHLESYIKLLGNRNDVDILMRKAQAFVLPSMFEGMPLVLIEAQSAGLPCVSADTFSREVDFNIGLIEWLKINDSVELWAEAVERAANKRKATKESVEQAIKRYNFDSKLFAKKVCDLYQQDLIARGK